MMNSIKKGPPSDNAGQSVLFIRADTRKDHFFFSPLWERSQSRNIDVIGNLGQERVVK